MSSFFTLPASQRKRKREDRENSRRPQASSKPSRNPPKKRREARDESISGSESEENDDISDSDAFNSFSDRESSDADSDEDAAGRRTRLAERYLENTRQQILAEGFDAKDIDEELLAQRMGERLKEDTAESKGKLYRWIANNLDYSAATATQVKTGSGTPTGIAVVYPYMYTVTSDMSLTKFQLQSADINGTSQSTDGKGTVKPKQIATTSGNRKRNKDPRYQHHTRAILCVAASSDGKFVATGGRDRKIIVWDAATLKPLKVFLQHRDAVTSLCFRRGTNQLFSASKDRTIKIWSLNELAYVETLYGHQDEVLAVSSLNNETCVTAGARDRTARYWRVVEENQLVFRGGGSGASKRSKTDHSRPDNMPNLHQNLTKSYHEGSIDCIAMVDEETFVTGSDNGSLCLWNIQKKKPIFNLPFAHGFQPPLKPDEASAETNPDPDVTGDPQPRWITSLAAVPFSDLLISGSWDGTLRAWKITEDKRSIELAGSVRFAGDENTHHGELPQVNGHHENGDSSNVSKVQPCGFVNDLAVYERGERGAGGISVVAAVGKDHRFGRWLRMPGSNRAVTISIPIAAKDSQNLVTTNGV